MGAGFDVRVAALERPLREHTPRFSLSDPCLMLRGSGQVVPPTVWASAHTTQFVELGWKMLHSGSGELAAGGSYLTMVSPAGDAVSIIIETGMAGKRMLLAQIDLRAGVLLTWHVSRFSV